MVPNCCRQPTETVTGEPFPRFCDIHKSMLDVSTVPQPGEAKVSTSGCRTENCTTMPSFGWEASQVAVFCRLHAQSGMVNVTNRGVQHKVLEQQTDRIPHHQGGGGKAPPAEPVRASAPAAASTQNRPAATSVDRLPVRMGDRGKSGPSLDAMAGVAAAPVGYPAVTSDNDGPHAHSPSTVSKTISATVRRAPIRFDQYRSQAMSFGNVRGAASSNSEHTSYGVADSGRKLCSMAAAPRRAVAGPVERHSTRVGEGYGDQGLHGVRSAREVPATAEDGFVRVGCHNNNGHPSAASAKNAAAETYQPFGRVRNPSKQVGPVAALAGVADANVSRERVLKPQAGNPARPATSSLPRRSIRIVRVTDDDGPQVKVEPQLDSADYRFDDSHDAVSALTEDGRLSDPLSAYTMAGTAQVRLG